MIRRVWPVLALLAPLTTGCAGSHGASQPQAANGAAVLMHKGTIASVPYAAPGTVFDVRLDQPIDTRLSTPGQPISATLAQPIKASDGSVLVAAGTRIDGKVAGIGHANGPHVVLAFDALRLRGGMLPVGVRVLSAQQSSYRYLPAGTGVTSMQAPQPGEAPSRQGTTEISMPQGAIVQLALTRPIIEGKGLK